MDIEIKCLDCGLLVPAKTRTRKRCVKCAETRHREQVSDWRGANPARFNDQQRRYREANPEKVAAWHRNNDQQRRYREANPEKVAAWHRNKPSRAREKQKEYSDRYCEKVPLAVAANYLGVRKSDVPIDLLRAKQMEIKIKRKIKEIGNEGH